jgi:serine/threonine protein phosphatase PrpC
VAEAARSLAKLAIERGSKDNVTVVVVDLTPYLASAWATAGGSNKVAIEVPKRRALKHAGTGAGAAGHPRNTTPET